ncbi:MAG: transcriptional repressor LexA, partial [Fibrobacterota bacterium]
KNGSSPSFYDIKEHFGFASPNAVSKHISALTKKGFLESRPGAVRTLRSLRPDPSGVPLIGNIAAGNPAEAIENPEDIMDLRALGIDNSSGEYFALTVRGDSMINAHIADGDTVIIKKQSFTSASDIAAVIYGGEATLKYISHKNGGITLIPANDSMEPFEVPPDSLDSFRILGKAVNVIRKL